MMAEEFLQKFHSLEGVTIGQRKKNFFKLLHQNASLKNDNAVLDSIATNLKPTTYLEELFKVELLIYFRRGKELMQVLKEGNDVFVSKITKQKWFFLDSFLEVDAKQLVNEILPYMSFSVRMKVLKKLSRYLKPEQFDNIFDAVSERYGIFIARQFLIGCTSDKIKDVIKEYRVTLNEQQLKFLYRKDSSFIEFYFNHVAPSAYGYKKLLKFLYVEDAALYSYLKYKFKFDELKFGRRLTKKIVSEKREDIVKAPVSYSNLYMKAVIRKLGKESVQLFCNTLPPFMDRLDVCNLAYLMHFAKKYHYNLLFGVVPSHYKIQYVDYPKIITTSLLDNETNNEKRAVLAKVRVDLGEDEYIKYLTSKESIPLLKEKINVTSDIYQRRNFIKWLVETCEINKDTKSLVEVMKYFVGRHKNDDDSIISSFLNLIEYKFNFLEFSEEMWNLYYEIQITYTLKHDQDLDTYKKIQSKPFAKYFLTGGPHQHFSYLYFLHKKNEPVDELLAELFSTDIEYPMWGTYGKDFEKYVFTYIIDLSAKRAVKDDDDVLFNCNLIYEMDVWNDKYPNDKFNFYNYPFLVDSFNRMIKTFDHYRITSTVLDQFRKKIFTTGENEHKNEYLRIYWERLDEFKSNRDFPWFLTFEPTVIRDNFDKFLENVLENSFTSNSGWRRSRRRSKRTTYKSYQLRTLYKIKKFTHLDLDQKSIQYCLSKINDENCNVYKPQYVGCLSVLMKPDEYVSFADANKPANKKLDLQNEKEVKLYNLQCAIGENFKNTKTHTVLYSLFNYCAGDYFHHSLKSLYSILYRTPENLLTRYLNYLANRAVSVRKHALYFTCELTTVEQVESMLKVLNKSEGVLSLQKYMFSASIKYFLKNPLDQFFEMVKSNLSFITKEDSESQNLIVEKCSDIPIKFRCRYIKYSWEHFEKVIEIQKDLLRLKSTLLSRLLDEELIKEIPFDFAMRIIREHFTVDKKTKLHCINEFVFTFLMARDEKSDIFKTVFEVLDKFERRNQFGFFYDWYRRIMECKRDDLVFLNPFVDYYEKKIDVIKDFSDYNKIFFLKLKMDRSSNKIPMKIVDFLNGLISNYGPHVVTVFAKELKQNLKYFQEYPNELCLNLIKNYPLVDVAILVMELIVEPYDSVDVKQREIYGNTLDALQAMSDAIIQIVLHRQYKERLIQSKSFIQQV